MRGRNVGTRPSKLLGRRPTRAQDLPLLDEAYRSFARASEGTYQQSATDMGVVASAEPRYEGKSRALLVLREHQNTLSEDPLAFSDWTLQGSTPPTVTPDDVASPLAGDLADLIEMAALATCRCRDSGLTLVPNTYYLLHVWFQGDADPRTIRLRIQNFAGDTSVGDPYAATAAWGRAERLVYSDSGASSPYLDLLNSGDANPNAVHVWAYNCYASRYWLDTIRTSAGTHYGDVETWSEWDPHLSTSAVQIPFWPRWADTDLVSGEERWLWSVDGDQYGVRARHDGTGVLFEYVSGGVVKFATDYATVDARFAAEDDDPHWLYWDPEAAVMAYDGFCGPTGTASSWPLTGTARRGGIAGGAGEADAAVGMPRRSMPADPFLVVLGAGQSNDIGTGQESALPAEVQGLPWSEIDYWYDLDTSVRHYSGDPSGVGPPARVDMDLCTRTGGSRRWGPTLMFSHTLREAGIKHGVLHVASSGSSLNDTGTNTWSELEKGSGYLYDRFVQNILDGCTAFQALHPNRPVRIVVLKWIHGEGDCNTQPPALAYDTNAENFLAQLWTDCARWIDPAIPPAFCFNKAHINLARPYVSDLRDSQDNIAAGDSAATPRIMINGDDLALIQPENVHYEVSDRGELGVRLAQAYLARRPTGLP